MKVVIGNTLKELLTYQQEKLKYGIPLDGRVALWHVFQKFTFDPVQRYLLSIKT